MPDQARPVLTRAAESFPDERRVSDYASRTPQGERRVLRCIRGQQLRCPIRPK